MKKKIKEKTNEKMHQAKSRLTLSIISFVSLLTLFCGDPVPVKEMNMAEHAILRAESADAEKYAPIKYQQAKNTLLSAHGLVSKGDYRDAKEKAKKAKALAKQVFESAAPKFAKETKGEATKILGKVKERYGEQLAQAEYEVAQDEYKVAQDLIASGDKKFNEGKHMEAYADYKQARFGAEMARNAAEAQAEIQAEKKKKIAEEEKKLRPFKIWKSDSDKILSMVKKLFPYTRDYNDLEFQEEEKKKLFEKTLKKINKNLRNEGKHIKLEIVRLKEVSKVTELTAYGEKYKSRLVEKYKARLRLKYPDSLPNRKPNRDWDWDLGIAVIDVAEIGLNMGSASISLNERIKLKKAIQDYRAYDRIIKSKMAACKKCSHIYVGLSFELPQPAFFCTENSYEKEEGAYSSKSSYLISKECASDDYDSHNFKTNDILIYGGMHPKFAPELMTLEKGALYSLNGELYHVDYERDGGKTALILILNSPKSIMKIQMNTDN